MCRTESPGNVRAFLRASITSALLPRAHRQPGEACVLTNTGEQPEFRGTRDSLGGFSETNEVEISAWKLEYYKQQCIQWPYAWADLMLAARSA